jgi:sugar phosphate isomerase/epimerase
MSGYRFSVSEFTTWPWTFAEDIERYAALGVTAIEICEAKLDPQRADEQLAEVKRAGLAITSVQPKLHSLFPDQFRPEPKEPGERMALFRQTVDRFGKAAPGVPLITITGHVPGGNFRHAFATGVKEYKQLADYAADRGVRIAVEPLHPILMNVDSFICTLPEAMRLVEAVNKPNFGVWIDVWHIWDDPAAERHIAACGDRIFGVHVNDWHEPRHFGDRATIGRGQIPLQKLLRAFHKTGYRDPYTLEIFSMEFLPDSLWKQDMNQVIRDNQRGFAAAWEASACA